MLVLGCVIIRDDYNTPILTRQAPMYFPGSASALAGVRLAIPIESKPLTASCIVTSPFLHYSMGNIS